MPPLMNILSCMGSVANERDGKYLFSHPFFLWQKDATAFPSFPLPAASLAQKGGMRKNFR